MAYVNREFLLEKIAERKEALVGAYGEVYEAPEVRVNEWEIWDEMEQMVFQADTLFTEEDVLLQRIKPRNVKWDFSVWVGECKCGGKVYREEMFCNRCGSKLDWSEVKE